MPATFRKSASFSPILAAPVLYASTFFLGYFIERWCKSHIVDLEDNVYDLTLLRILGQGGIAEAICRISETSH